MDGIHQPGTGILRAISRRLDGPIAKTELGGAIELNVAVVDSRR
jgi:hypothetical protein